MKILFINSHTGTATLPLASACLASMLEDRFANQVDCPILEPAPGFSIRNTTDEILSIKPDLIALTIYSWSRAILLELSESLTAANDSNHPLIIAGGPEVTADPLSIQNHPSISLAVSGEGELALVSIVEKLLHLPREAHSTALAEFPAPYSQSIIENLDNLPSPWKASALKGRRYEDTVWELTRGCPFNCHFCFESKGSDRVRHKSLSKAAEELKQLQKRGTGNIFLLDPTFNASPNRAKELLRLFISQAPELRYHMEVRTEFLDEEQAELYSELGCTLQIGLQTAHPEVARNIGRPFSPEGFQEKLLPLHEYAVPYGLDLIYGLPGDNLEGFRESLDFALSCAPNHLDIFPLSVLPGTRLRETARGLGLEYLKSAPYTVTGRKNKNHSFSPEDLSLAANLTTAVDELYNKGRAVPWFLLCTDVLKLRPVEIIEAFIRDTEELNPIEELEKPSRLRDFIQRLVRNSNQSDFAPLLGDIICLFTLDSACREGLTLPSAITFTFNPQALNEHLEMGINDLEELSAFVPKQTGNYQLSVEENILVFKYVTGKNSL